MRLKYIQASLYTISAIIILLSFYGCPNPDVIGKPNIVIILVDDLGWADVGCYGNQYYETPNINHLAATGMKFTNGYAASPVCSPTRASLMTGRYPARLGITDWIRARFQGGKRERPIEYTGGPDKRLLCPANPFWMELEEITIAEILKSAGYVTCHIGKWHLGYDEWYPDRQGFDYNMGGCDYGQPPSYFDPYVNDRLPQGIPTLKPRQEGEYLSDREADEATNFIENTVQQNKPFFLYMAHYAVHTPIQGKLDLVNYYKTKPVPNDKHYHPEYAAMVHSVDQAVGKILNVLRDLKIQDETIVFFTSDNGGLMLPQGKDGGYKWTDNHPLRAGKGFPYEGGIREPFIVKWPGVTEPGSKCDVPVSTIDILPTICAIINQPPPSDIIIDGENIVPLLNGGTRIDRKALFWHFPHYWANQTVSPNSTIRAGDWKLIRWYENNKLELFNLREDFAEQRDLSQDLPEKVGELQIRLDGWLKDINAKIPIENPNYTGTPQ